MGSGSIPLRGFFFFKYKDENVENRRYHCFLFGGRARDCLYCCIDAYIKKTFVALALAITIAIAVTAADRDRYLCWECEACDPLFDLGARLHRAAHDFIIRCYRTKDGDGVFHRICRL